MYITMFKKPLTVCCKHWQKSHWYPLEGIQKEAKQMTNNKNRVYAMLT